MTRPSTNTRNRDMVRGGEPTTLLPLGNTQTFITPILIAGDESVAVKYLRFYGGHSGGPPGGTLTYYGAFLRADTIKGFSDIGRTMPSKVFGVIQRFRVSMIKDVTNRHVLQEVYFQEPVILRGGAPTYLAITSDESDALLSAPMGSQGQTLDPAWVAQVGGGPLPNQLQAATSFNAGISYLLLDEIGCLRYLP